jgi:branched-chain amino acid transport system ATP-binding protein
MSVLLVEQFARKALSIADYAAVMSGGRISTFCEPADLEDVTGTYMGTSA